MSNRRLRNALLGWSIACLLASHPGNAQAQRLRWSPEIGLESRVFIDEPQFDRQFSGFQNSLIATGNLQWVSRDRNTRANFEPFLRLDSRDSERSYLDIREASLSYRAGNWDVLVGVTQVFWGVAESRNVVDVINQFDTVEDFDQVEKLGQPAVRLGKRTRLGRIELYYLPYFREQRLPGPEGRLRFEPFVATASAEYERDGEEWAGDVALRYKHTIGKFDVGLHGFYGTSRNPAFTVANAGEALIPVYQERVQTGIDVQYTSGSWLWKHESAAVDVGGDSFISTVSGLEYTFFDIRGSGLDIGLIGEYLYDTRNGENVPITLFDDDVFGGVRITANDSQDTELLAGAILDRDSQSVIGTIEFQRRLGARMLLEVEGRYFRGSDDPLLGAFDNDSHLTLRLTTFF